MKLIVAGFLIAVLGTAVASVGFAFWDGRYSLRDPQLRAIHYDTRYDMSAQRRIPAERPR